MRAAFRSAAARRRDATAQGRQSAPPHAAARSRHSPASGPKCRPAPPRDYTLRSRGGHKTTGRCMPPLTGTDAETGRNAHRLALHWGTQESDEGRTSHEACGLHFDCTGDIGFAVRTGGGRTMPLHRGEAGARGLLSAPGNGARRPAEGPDEAQQAAQQKPYEPMTQEDAQLAKSMRGICRGC